MQNQRTGTPSVTAEQVGNINTPLVFKPYGTNAKPGEQMSLSAADRAAERVATIRRVATFSVDPSSREILLDGVHIELGELMLLADDSMIRLDELIDAIHGVGGYPGNAQVIFFEGSDADLRAAR